MWPLNFVVIFALTSGQIPPQNLLCDMTGPETRNEQKKKLHLFFHLLAVSCSGFSFHRFIPEAFGPLMQNWSIYMRKFLFFALSLFCCVSSVFAFGKYK